MCLCFCLAKHKPAYESGLGHANNTNKRRRRRHGCFWSDLALAVAMAALKCLEAFNVSNVCLSGWPHAACSSMSMFPFTQPASSLFSVLLCKRGAPNGAAQAGKSQDFVNSLLLRIPIHPQQKSDRRWMIGLSVPRWVWSS